MYNDLLINFMSIIMSQNLPLTIKIIGVTANCANSTMGELASSAIANLLKHEDKPSAVIINCQEVNYKKQLKQLQKTLTATADLALISSGLMVTRTKFETEVLKGHTGMATFVIFNKNKVNASFTSDESQQVRGQNKNKGGFLNTLMISEKDGLVSHRVRTITGHLNSNSEKKRANDWKNIKQKNAFKAQTWEELVAKTPILQVAGYDANTRDIWDLSTNKQSSLWNKEILNPHIAPLALAPLGTQRYSAENTYKTQLLAITPDKKRPGFAKCGSLDFVALQNNTNFSTQAINHIGYEPAFFNLRGEDGTKRDHNVIISALIKVNAVSDFERVRNYIASELIMANQELIRNIVSLEESEVNKVTLLAIHQRYLSPEGELIAKLQALSKTSKEDAKLWFTEDTLQRFLTKPSDDCLKILERSFEKIKKLLTLSCLFFHRVKTPFLQFHQAYFTYISAIYTNTYPATEPLQNATQALIEVIADPKRKTYLYSFQEALENVNNALKSDPIHPIKDKTERKFSI